MHISAIPFGTTDWSRIPPTAHAGEQGTAYWRTQQFGDLRVRMVEYTPGTTGASRATSCCAWRASCTPSWRMAAASH